MTNYLNDIQRGSFLLTSDHPEQYYEQISSALKNGFEELEKHNIDASTIIGDTFFSARNIDIIQRWLIKDVKRKINVLIPYQKIEHIMEIMTLIYDTYGQHLPFGLKQQIYELDAKVVETTVPHIILELRSRTNYLDTIQNANYIDNPLYVGNKQRVLPSTLNSI
jgi:hypothetical protein